MKRGDVIFSKNFEFSDGDKADKLLIVLNEASAQHPHLLLLTTSQQWKRNSNSGCHSKDNYYVIPPKTDWFDKTTWILFNDIVEYDFSRELQDHFKGKLATLTTLKEITIKSIINCLKLSDDISPYQISLVDNMEKKMSPEIEYDRNQKF